MAVRNAASGPQYPLRLGSHPRELVRQDGEPFLIVGEAAWSILVGPTKDEAVRYLDDRRRRGFNTLLVNLLEYKFCPNPPNNAYGVGPFLTPGDFRTPNDAYFDHARWVLERAAERGLQVLLAPSYLGFAHAGWPGTQLATEGWYSEVARNGFEGCREYGQFLGRRFGDLDNLLWVMGGDRDPGDVRLEICQMAEGIRESDSRHLFTAHCAPESVPADVYDGERWLQVNNTYTYGIVHAKVYADYIRVPAMPSFLMESTYENEHSASDVQLRRQAYWSVLRGGSGHIFGCTPVWWFSDGWEDWLDSAGSRGMAHFAAAFQGRRWFDLVPDPAEGVAWNPSWQGRRLIMAGLGESRGLDFCAAARTPDGQLAMIYMPSARRLTLDLSLVSGRLAHVTWFDPIGGRWLDGGSLPVKASVDVDPPSAQDWLLVIDAVLD